MFRSRTRHMRGHAAIIAWSYLTLNKSRKLAGLQSPAACATRAGGDCDPTSRIMTFLNPRKRRITERGPEAGVRGASPGVWVRRTRGACTRIQRGVYPL